MLTSPVLDIPSEIQQNFAELLEKSFSVTLKPGVIVAGEIIKIEKDGLVVDIGGKSEGFVPLKEIPGSNNLDELLANYQQGQVLELFLLSEHDSQDDTKAHYTLSIRRVMMWKNWDRLLAMRDSKEIVETTVMGTTKGGVIVNILGFKGFVPASQLRVAKTLHDLIGDVLPARVLEVDRDRNKLILSHREAVFAQKAAQREATLSRLKEGDVVDGEIVKVTDFGVFIDIEGIDGLLPLSEISWRRIHHPSELLTLGQRLTVCVLTVDRDLQRISLSLKRMETDPWDSVNEQFHNGDTVEGRISKLLGSGVLAELTPGIEAYCPYDRNRRSSFMLSEAYTFRILSIASRDRRITLEYTPE